MGAYAREPVRSARCTTSSVQGLMRNLLCASSSASIEGAMRFLRGDFAQIEHGTYSIAEIAPVLTGGTLETELEVNRNRPHLGSTTESCPLETKKAAS